VEGFAAMVRQKPAAAENQQEKLEDGSAPVGIIRK
jgi:hypothetical protein